VAKVAGGFRHVSPSVFVGFLLVRDAIREPETGSEMEETHETYSIISNRYGE